MTKTEKTIYLFPAILIGRNGWIIGCDPDTLEISNLPRIPYACLENAGRSKAALAKAYARYKAPELNVRCYKKGIEDEKMQQLAKEANLIIGNVDKDGPRKILNSIAARYLVPYIDLATEIIPENNNYEAIGQIQTFIPGKTGCLMCSGVIDPSEAAFDLLSEEEQVEHANVGYIRGTNETPAPSVLHLNGVTSHLAISQLLRLVFGDEFKGKEYLQYDRQRCQLITAAVETNADCPICGTKGYLGDGDKETVLMPELDSNISLEISNGNVIEK